MERALESLGHLTEVGGGDFLKRRMKKEGWPVLAQLLKRGVQRETGLARQSQRLIGSSEKQAPAILARARLAVVSAIDRSARGILSVNELLIEASMNLSIALLGYFQRRQTLASRNKRSLKTDSSSVSQMSRR